jgi:hypothetical protein
MVFIGRKEPVVSDPRDESADADIISSGSEDFGAFASRWPELTRIVRSRRARIIAVPVLAAALATAALLATDSHPASLPAQPGQQITILNTTAGVAGPYGWVYPIGCRDGRGCPRGG